jgi:hypothetical protein
MRWRAGSGGANIRLSFIRNADRVSAVIAVFWDKAVTKGFGGERWDLIEATLAA